MKFQDPTCHRPRTARAPGARSGRRRRSAPGARWPRRRPASSQTVQAQEKALASNLTVSTATDPGPMQGGSSGRLSPAGPRVRLPPGAPALRHALGRRPCGRPGFPLAPCALQGPRGRHNSSRQLPAAGATRRHTHGGCDCVRWHGARGGRRVAGDALLAGGLGGQGQAAWTRGPRGSSVWSERCPTPCSSALQRRSPDVKAVPRGGG